MTAAGMSMHMAMINARASANALDRKDSKERSGSSEIWLTESEIQRIRRESGRDNSISSRDVNSIATLRKPTDDNAEILPKCSTCCTTM